MSTPARKVLVIRTVPEADHVLGLTLADPDGGPLPSWEPGAHIDLVLPSGTVRPYSLAGDPEDNSVYRLGVLHEPNGRGGSAEVHNTALLGRSLEIRGPRNNFRFAPGAHTVLIAGGIGITPLIPMVRQLERAGNREWTLLYGARSLSAMAYLHVVRAMRTGRILLVPQDTDGLPDLDGLLSELPEGAIVYCCGPEGLLAAVREQCELYLPPGALHFERFTPAGQIPRPDGAFSRSNIEIELRRTGMTLQVPPGKSILEVVQEVRPDVSYSCESGICGTCETAVLEGTPQHLDDEADSRGPESMLICVSRAHTSKLVLDL